jgi:hypothetical protein
VVSSSSKGHASLPAGLIFANPMGGEGFALHRRKGYEDGLIQLSANPVFILGRKVLTFRKDAASMRANDISAVGFFC